MRPIPQKLKDKLSKDKYYKNCVLCRADGVQWHHNLIFGGRQVNAEFCILPLCPDCHRKADRKDVKEKLNWIMLNRATDEELIFYSKAINYLQLKERLNGIYNV